MCLANVQHYAWKTELYIEKKEYFEGKLTENLVKLKHIGKALEKAKILAPQKSNICFNVKGIVEDFKNYSEKFAKKKIR